MKYVMATHNPNKLLELQRILEPLHIEVTTADLQEVEETGTTFAENAYLKAKAACEQTGLPAVRPARGRPSARRRHRSVRRRLASCSL